MIRLLAFQTEHNLQRNTEEAGRGTDCGECRSFFQLLSHFKDEASHPHFNFFSQRPVPLAEIKVSPPKFDLAATNFPPLPGCVVSTQGEPVLENRMSDVVRGLYRDKVRTFGEEEFVNLRLKQPRCDVHVSLVFIGRTSQ